MLGKYWVAEQILGGGSYVYWTVHHFDSWIKIDQLDVTFFYFNYLMLNMFRMLIHPSLGACDLFVELFHVLYCCGTMCVGVTVWFSLYKDTTPPQPNHTVTPTHIEPEQYNTWNKSTISRKLLKMVVLTFETCWAVNSEIIKQVTSSWSILIQPWILFLVLILCI